MHFDQALVAARMTSNPAQPAGSINQFIRKAGRQPRVAASQRPCPLCPVALTAPAPAAAAAHLQIHVQRARHLAQPHGALLGQDGRQPLLPLAPATKDRRQAGEGNARVGLSNQLGSDWPQRSFQACRTAWPFPLLPAAAHRAASSSPRSRRAAASASFLASDSEVGKERLRSFIHLQRGGEKDGSSGQVCKGGRQAGRRAGRWKAQQKGAGAHAVARHITHARQAPAPPPRTHWSTSAASAALCGARTTGSAVSLSGGSAMSFFRSRLPGGASCARPPPPLNLSLPDLPPPRPRPPPPPPRPPGNRPPSDDRTCCCCWPCADEGRCGKESDAAACCCRCSCCCACCACCICSAAPCCCASSTAWPGG